MAKKSTKKKDKKIEEDIKNIETDESVRIAGMHIKKETRNSIIAIFFFMFALIFALSGFGLGGVAGNFIYKNLKYLLGVGYALLPIVFILLGSTSYKSTRPNFGTSNTIGSLLFLLSGLGLINIIKTGSAGSVGKISSWPFVKFFDVYLAFIILLAIFVISIVIMFDKRPSISGIKQKIKSWFTKEEFEEDHSEEEEENTEEPMEEPVTENENTDQGEEENPPKQPILENEKQDGFLFSATYKPTSEYKAPPLSLLKKNDDKAVTGDIKANSNIIKRTLQNFGIDVEMDEVTIGPTVTRFALKPAQGVRLSKITALQNELRLALAAPSIRIQAPIPGKSLVGIEVPNQQKATVDLRSLLGSKEFKDNPKPLLAALGRGVSGKAEYANIAKMPHLLIAGATGSGKSVTVHTLITSLLYRNGPQDMRFIMIDPKRVELTLYNGIPHLLTPVITNPKKAILALKWAVSEMERRYDLLERCTVRDIDSYHKQYLGAKAKEGVEGMPYILIIIDELADIMTTYPRELEAGIVRLAQMSRAVGIHLILSTQRPSVNVITGLIKANVPSRIALQVASQIDSRTILDNAGAEKLLGAGDMLWSSGEMAQPQRVQCAFISEDEVKSVTGYLKNRYRDELPDDLNLGEGSISTEKSIFSSDIDDDRDELFGEAKKIVIEEKKASTSYIQRRLKIGYSRAARILDELEQAGIVGPANGAKPREILADSNSINKNPTPEHISKPIPHMVTIRKDDDDEFSETEESENNDNGIDDTFEKDPYEENTMYPERDENEDEFDEDLDKPLSREDDENTDNEYDENDKY